VIDASEKLLLVCEDSASIDDGLWSPNFVNNAQENALSLRHDRPLPPGVTDLPFFGDPLDVDDPYRGNVGCADGHAEFVTRLWTRTPLHYLPLMAP
jgi:hypothetical protein